MGEERQDQERSSDDNSEIQDTTTEKKCSECGAPVDDVRVTCPKCGAEYKPEDHTSTDMGHEFTAGTAVDDEGNEVPDHPTGN